MHEHPKCGVKMDKKNSTKFVIIFVAILFATSALLTWIMIGNYNKDSSKERAKLTQAYKKFSKEVYLYDKERGQKVYGQFCMRCHAVNGEGTMSAPPLKGSAIATGEPSKIVRILTHGMKGKIQREGKVYDLNMPAFPMITHQDLAHVINYVRSSWGNEASVVSTTDAIQIKVKYVERATPWEELEL